MVLLSRAAATSGATLSSAPAPSLVIKQPFPIIRELDQSERFIPILSGIAIAFHICELIENAGVAKYSDHGFLGGRRAGGGFDVFP